MSITAAILILVIIVVRQLTIHKLPKRTFMILWGVVLLRLFIPISINIPTSAPMIMEVDNVIGIIAEMGNIPIINSLPVTLPSIDVQESVNVYISFSPIIIVWITGMVSVFLFILMAHLRSRKEYKASLPINNIYINKWLDEQKGMRSIQVRQSDRITAPLTYGILRPVILFPKTTNWQDTRQLKYVLTHETAHIRRFDVFTKWLLSVALCIHWFNPLVWVMYALANRDIELSCDEAVVRTCGESTKSAYAMALIGLEENRGTFSPLCTNFAKNSIEERIVAIMKMKKRSTMSILLAVVLVSVLALGALTVFASSTEEMYLSQYEDNNIPVEDENNGWEEWLEWFNALTPEEQSKVSVRPPQENPVPFNTYPVPMIDAQAELRSPYRIATTLEEVRAIIALNNGTIPVTNVEVPEIINRQAKGVIITEQCLYEALAILNEIYFINYPSSFENIVTTRLLPMLTPEEIESQEYHRANRVRDSIDFLYEIFHAAVAEGLLDGSGIYPDDFDLLHEEAKRIFAVYGYDADNWPTNERAHEAAHRLFSN